MPQMAPLMWLYLYFFFLLSFMMFLTVNHFIKPYQKMTVSLPSSTSIQASWKL